MLPWSKSTSGFVATEWSVFKLCDVCSFLGCSWRRGKQNGFIALLWWKRYPSKRGELCPPRVKFAVSIYNGLLCLRRWNLMWHLTTATGLLRLAGTSVSPTESRWFQGTMSLIIKTYLRERDKSATSGLRAVVAISRGNTSCRQHPLASFSYRLLKAGNASVAWDPSWLLLPTHGQQWLLARELMLMMGNGGGPGWRQV